MMRSVYYSIFFIGVSFVSSCVAPNETFKKIPPGIWRGALLLDRKPVLKFGDDRDIVKNFDIESELPFNFEVVYDNDSVFHLIIHNDTERIKVDDITFGTDKSTAKDTIIINFPIYDTKIEGIYEDGVIEGDWIVNYRDNYRIPFKAVHGVADRYAFVSENAINIDGTWACTFEIGTPDEYKAVGVFRQKGDIVTGTFLTETGDYRFLEGKVAGSKVYLTTFDGAHAYLFNAKMMEDGRLSGIFRSGSQYTTNWEGVIDANASLADAYQLTKLVSDQPLNFTFVNTENEMISIHDEKFKNKIKIIQIMGTWCPNCMDETIFLKEFFNDHHPENMVLISIGFERYKEADKSIAALKRFKEKMHIDHEVLYGGHYSKKEASQKLPQLDKIMSYPTLLIVDKNNKIIKIHTGFSGPATPGYEQYKKEFAQIITDLKTH